jgi:hypothetical protein
MTRTETLTAIKESTRVGGEFEWCDCEQMDECPRCAIAWLLQEIEYLNTMLSVATLEFSVKCEPLVEANRILGEDRDRLRAEIARLDAFRIESYLASRKQD